MRLYSVRDVTSTLSPAERDALADRLGPERGEERRDDRAELERAQHRDVELRNPAQQGEHRVARAHAQRREPVRHSVGLLVQRAVCHLAARSVLAEPDQGDPFTVVAPGMAGHRFVGDVQSAARQTVERVARLVPGERAPSLLVVARGWARPPSYWVCERVRSASRCFCSTGVERAAHVVAARQVFEEPVAGELGGNLPACPAPRTGVTHPE